LSLSRCVGWAAVAVAALYPLTTLAQQGPLAQQAPPAQQPQQAPPPQQQQKGVVWEQMPRMNLEQQYAGPLKDTAIQRWRDPQVGIICYVYTPFTAQHSPPTNSGYVQYGANTIGAISCLEPAPPPPAPKAASPPPGKRSSAPAPHTAAQQPSPAPAAPLPEIQPFGRY
jgi:hypothetical protein